LIFAYDGGRGAGGTGSILVDDKKIGEAKIGKTKAMCLGWMKPLMLA